MNTFESEQPGGVLSIYRSHVALMFESQISIVVIVNESWKASRQGDSVKFVSSINSQVFDLFSVHSRNG